MADQALNNSMANSEPAGLQLPSGHHTCKLKNTDFTHLAHFLDLFEHISTIPGYAATATINQNKKKQETGQDVKWHEQICIYCTMQQSDFSPLA